MRFQIKHQCDIDSSGPSAYTSIGNIQEMIARDAHWKELKHVSPGIKKYWPIIHELTMIDGMTLKGKEVIIPSQLQMHVLKQLHSNNMGIEKT